MVETAVCGLGDDALMARTRELVRQCAAGEAELLACLGEIDERRLHCERAYPSLFAFCVGELRFSEDVACNRIAVARAARKFPMLLQAIREGTLHVAGARVLAPHLTRENVVEVLTRAARKSKREIEELAAAIAPRPGVPDCIRAIPSRDAAEGTPAVPVAAPAAAAAATSATASPRDAPALVAPPSPRPALTPLSAETFLVRFTASRVLRDKIGEAKDLLRHRIPDGDLARVFETALDALIERVKKERFALVQTPRTAPSLTANGSRHIPAAIRRAVYERDGGRCTFVDAHGKRCDARGFLEFDHEDGFAITGTHDLDRIRLRCRAHNQHAAEKMYGREWMARAREGRTGTREVTAAGQQDGLERTRGTGKRDGILDGDKPPAPLLL